VQIGVIEDTENRDRLAKLLRFYSSKSEDGLTSLTDYTSRMKEGQKSVYYMAADSVQVRCFRLLRVLRLF
jgi:HSP90 family molecular chaperone